jgi:hypothetical protein
VTPSRAKNAIRSALREIVDKQPSDAQVASVWEYFDNSCAYCGVSLIRAERKGHMDHLVPHTRGGTNHFGNRVLACAVCNGDEKRDEPWEEFLARKSQDTATHAQRREKIEAWVARHPGWRPALPADVIEPHVAKVIAEFDKACNAIRTGARSAAQQTHAASRDT